MNQKLSALDTPQFSRESGKRSSSADEASQIEVAIPRLLLTSREAAQALSISERKLWELTNRRDIPSVRIGRSVRYRPSDLDDFIRRNM